MVTEPNASSLRVAYSVTEVYPHLKTGGLADVSAALPPALRELGIDVRLVVPDFPAFATVVEHRGRIQSFRNAFGATDVGVARACLPDSEVPIYLVEAPELFDRPGNPYVDDFGVDYADNHRRFSLFGWVVAQLADGDWWPDVIHAHDWHAGLIPAWLASFPGPRATSIFTIHNLAYQGFVAAAQVPELGLPVRFNNINGIEYHGGASFMKAGLYFADMLTTVSPTYAREIQTPSGGVGLDGLLHTRIDELVGILNGVDSELWNPATDPHLAANYSATDPGPKNDNKTALQREFGLSVDSSMPLCIVVSRLTEQKGIDIVLAAIPEIIAGDAQLLVLGSGDAALESTLEDSARQHPGRIAVRIGYDETLSHRMFGAGDFVLVPSRFEPCGLTQLYGLAYGTLPVVTPVGGLADTVTDATNKTEDNHSATGFVTRDSAGADLGATLTRALSTYRDPPRFRQMQRTAMASDHSWARAAQEYARLYQQLTAERLTS